jgi:hypothetical protein
MKKLKHQENYPKTAKTIYVRKYTYNSTEDTYIINTTLNSLFRHINGPANFTKMHATNTQAIRLTCA